MVEDRRLSDDDKKELIGIFSDAHPRIVGEFRKRRPETVDDVMSFLCSLEEHFGSPAFVSYKTATTE